MARLKFLKSIHPKTVTKRDSLLLGAQIGGGLVGTYATMKGANAFLEEASVLGNNVTSGSVLGVILIGGRFMMILMISL